MNTLKWIDDHQHVLNSTRELAPQIDAVGSLIGQRLFNGKKVLICGNGGSAADAQHIAAELTGRYKTNRRPLPGIALTTDTSALTAIANDFGYSQVFSRQVHALASEGDVFIGISTSGNSESVNNAMQTAKQLGCYTVGLLGRDGGPLKNLWDCALVVPSNDTPRIQEMHIMIGHIICEYVDKAVTA